jgi:hypothetical protein
MTTTPISLDPDASVTVDEVAYGRLEGARVLPGPPA